MKKSIVMMSCCVVLAATGCGSEDASGGPKASAAEEAAWNEARRTNTAAAYNAFAETYPSGDYSGAASAWLRIAEIRPIGLNLMMNTPPGTFMKVGPPQIDANGNYVPSGNIESVPAGTTITLAFETMVDGETYERELVATYDSIDGNRVIFKNDEGDCIWNDQTNGMLGYCEDAIPAPPDPSDINALMVYSWLAPPPAPAETTPEE